VYEDEKMYFLKLLHLMSFGERDYVFIIGSYFL
jgi:hypothetical protein